MTIGRLRNYLDAHVHLAQIVCDKDGVVTDYLSKMGIKTVPHPPYSPDLGPCDFWLFHKLTGCHYEIIEEMKEAV